MSGENCNKVVVTAVFISLDHMLTRNLNQNVVYLPENSCKLSTWGETPDGYNTTPNIHKIRNIIIDELIPLARCQLIRAIAQP
ncbi:hypothetical protein H6F47_25085 [Sphaerospermopsis sp. FACHB-1094]|uniref:hypothetical protein n=1 Tax=Sphaerospermopsis sp. FACHB-1094 TaxID=2692861 RepID=UPI0016850586|nr:hypothetical protein [Sphaerospermopsis sp. FACHB-1094]MBD2135600.1 hypothetical protein [Sphaerospermopsis sp. FACHB-1094]